jgi:C_GCAxxG_C_C family probable redox protein
MELSKSMSKEQVFSMLDQRVILAMEKSHNCAQSTFFALSEQFGLGGDDVLKALTPLPGIAERGETCGAITGALMAMGLIYGRDRLDDWEKYRSSLIPTNEFCRQFEKEMGSTLCHQIQDRSFGKSFNLMDPKDLKEFQRAGATSKCSRVVQKASKIAAEIILEDAQKV